MLKQEATSFPIAIASIDLSSFSSISSLLIAIQSSGMMEVKVHLALMSG